ncbi:hypothetical protein ACIPWI_25565 [Streptomyces sp. NPDC090046]|uniref:hypothetical protein n=1 Tax=Streptomyces sp. NPDC090046 TaxID=3365928 RepID=UPI00381B6704
MRTTTSLLASATAVAALLTLTACGGGGEAPVVGIGSGTAAGTDGGPHEGTLENPAKNGGVNGNAPKDGTAFQKLPKAATMAAAARFIDPFIGCEPIKVIPPGSEASTGPDEKFIKSATVIERGRCGGSRATIFMIKDPKAFQTVFKAETAAQQGGDPNGGIVVGQDFAMVSESSDEMSEMLTPQAGLLMLNCHEGFTPPSGYRKEPALVKGCVLTDYYVD